MIDKTLLTRYWKDFYIVTQEEREDFPYANVADAAKMLIKGRNWAGTWIEKLIQNCEEINLNKKSLKNLEQKVLIENNKLLSLELHPPAYVLKNHDLFVKYVWNKMDDAQKFLYHDLNKKIIDCTNKIEELETDNNNIELILKKLEKSTDWLVQYINWNKFELRSLQQ